MKTTTSILSDVSQPIRRIVFFLVFLFLTSVIMLAALYRYSSLTDKDSFARDIGKTLLQVIAVAVLGTTASLLLAEFNRKREALQKEQDRKVEEEQKKRDREQTLRDKQQEIERINQETEKELQRRLNENNDQLRKEMLGKATAIYANTKRARRLLRARAFLTPFYDVWDDDALMCLEVYDKYMEAINDSQLELEIIARDIETNEQAFSNPLEVIGYIRPMERYLGRIVSEYERRRVGFAGSPASFPISQLEEMRDMLGPTTNGRFDKEFIRNHKHLVAAIRHDLLTPPKPKLNP